MLFCKGNGVQRTKQIELKDQRNTSHAVHWNSTYLCQFYERGKVPQTSRLESKGQIVTQGADSVQQVCTHKTKTKTWTLCLETDWQGGVIAWPLTFLTQRNVVVLVHVLFKPPWGAPAEHQMNVERSLPSLSSANPFLFYSPSRSKRTHGPNSSSRPLWRPHKDASRVSLG